MTDLHEETASWAAAQAVVAATGYDATTPPDAPPQATQEPPKDGEEEQQQHKDEMLDALTKRVDMLEQDMARVLSVTAPDVEQV